MPALNVAMWNDLQKKTGGEKKNALVMFPKPKGQRLEIILVYVWKTEEVSSGLGLVTYQNEVQC